MPKLKYAIFSIFLNVAVYSRKCGGWKFKINDVDHGPPHCHVHISGRNTQVDLFTFRILNPPPHRLPPGVRRCLRKHRVEMLEAWERVLIV